MVYELYSQSCLEKKDIHNFNLAEKETTLHVLVRTVRTQGKLDI